MSFIGMLRRYGIYPTESGIEIATAILGAGPIPFGNVYYVDATNGADTNSGINRGAAFKTLSKAISAVTTNNNDVILINGNSGTVTETAMVTLSKNRVHIIGYNGVAGKMYGAAAKVEISTSATASSNIATFKNTGVRNTISGVKFLNSNTTGTNLYCVVEAGEYAMYRNCEFYKGSLLTTAGAAELALNGDSSQFFDCTFGSNADAQTGGTGVRATILVSKGIITGAVCRDVSFFNCFFWKWAGHVNNRFIYGSSATDIERMFYMEDCKFNATKKSDASPAAAVGFGAAQTVGSVILRDCVSVNCTALAQASVGVYTSGGGVATAA